MRSWQPSLAMGGRLCQAVLLQSTEIQQAGLFLCLAIFQSVTCASGGTRLATAPAPCRSLPDPLGLEVSWGPIKRLKQYRIESLRSPRTVFFFRLRRFSEILGSPVHLKPVILKPVGRMSILGEFDLPGVVPGCFPRTAVLRFKTRVAGPWLGIARTEARNPSDRKMAQDGTCGRLGLLWLGLGVAQEEPSLDQYQCRGKL